MDAHADTIRLFQEKADRLLSSRVYKGLAEGKPLFRFRAEVGAPVEIAEGGPPLEAIESFVLTLRFFVQDNEKISIRNIARLIEDSSAPDEIKVRVAQARRNFNLYLGRGCGIQIDGEHPTHREVLEVFLYGSLAHANDDKRQRYLSWAENQMIFGLMNAVFLATLIQFILMVRFLSQEMEKGFGDTGPLKAE